MIAMWLCFKESVSSVGNPLLKCYRWSVMPEICCEIIPEPAGWWWGNGWGSKWKQNRPWVYNCWGWLIGTWGFIILFSLFWYGFEVFHLNKVKAKSGKHTQACVHVHAYTHIQRKEGKRRGDPPLNREKSSAIRQKRDSVPVSAPGTH